MWDRIFNFENYGELLALLHNSILAGAILGLVGGLVGVFVMLRDLPFAVHGISELSFAGASFALLVGMNVVVGSMLGSLAAAAAIGLLGVRGDGDPGRGRTAGAVVAGHSGAIGPDESPDVTATVDIQRVTVRHHDRSPSTT